MPIDERLVSNVYHRGRLKATTELLIKDTSYYPSYNITYQETWSGTYLGDLSSAKPGGRYTIQLTGSVTSGGPSRIYYRLSGKPQFYWILMIRNGVITRVTGDDGYIDLDAGTSNRFTMYVCPVFGPNTDPYDMRIDWFHDPGYTQRPNIVFTQIATPPVDGVLTVNPARALTDPISLANMPWIWGGEDFVLQLQMNPGFGQGGFLTFSALAGGINVYDPNNPWVTNMISPGGAIDSGGNQFVLNSSGAAIVYGTAKVYTASGVDGLLALEAGNRKANNIIKRTAYAPLTGTWRNLTNSALWYAHDIVWRGMTSDRKVVMAPTLGMTSNPYMSAYINRLNDQSCYSLPISRIVNSGTTAELLNASVGLITINMDNFGRPQDRSQLPPVLDVIYKQTTGKKTINGRTTFFVDVTINEICTARAQARHGAPFFFNSGAVSIICAGETTTIGTWTEIIDDYNMRIYVDAVRMDTLPGGGGYGYDEYTFVNIWVCNANSYVANVDPSTPGPWVVSAGTALGYQINKTAYWDIMKNTDSRYNLADGTYQIVWSGEKGGLANMGASPTFPGYVKWEPGNIQVNSPNFTNGYPQTLNWMLVRYPDKQG